MARVSRKRKQEQAVEKLAVSRDEVYQCAVYIRLSKEENEKSDSHKLDNQEQVILNYVRKNSDLKIVKIYCDNGYSGTNFSRAAFGEMMQDIKSGIIRCVIVKEIILKQSNIFEQYFLFLMYVLLLLMITLTVFTLRVILWLP